MDHVRETSSCEKFLAGEPQPSDGTAVSYKVTALRFLQGKNGKGAAGRGPSPQGGKPSPVPTSGTPLLNQLWPRSEPQGNISRNVYNVRVAELNPFRPEGFRGKVAWRCLMPPQRAAVPGGLRPQCLQQGHRAQNGPLGGLRHPISEWGANPQPPLPPLRTFCPPSGWLPSPHQESIARSRGRASTAL